jgi:protein SCO1/2
MKTRRAFLATAIGASVAAVAVAAPKEIETRSAMMTCSPAQGGKNAKMFPHVIVQDQYKRKAWFYEELIQDKLVLVNFTSSKGENYYPIIKNMVKVQEIIADRLGKDVFMYTITTDPIRDTPDTLKDLADKFGAKWQFLSGNPDDIHAVLAAFKVHGNLHALTWIGNEKLGRWLNKPSHLHPLYIAESIARLSTGKHHKPSLARGMGSTLAGMRGA